MKKRENKENRKVSDHSSKGRILNFQAQQVAEEALKLIENYSRTGKLDIPDNRLVSQLYKYITQNEKKLTVDRENVIHSRNFKRISAGLLSGTGMVSYVTTVAASISMCGSADICNLLQVVGLATIGVGFSVGATALRRSNNASVVSSLLIAMEDKYGVSCIADVEKNKKKEIAVVSTIMKDEFLEELKAMSRYARYNVEKDSFQELLDLSDLTQEYIAAKRAKLNNGTPIDKCDFLDRLTQIEQRLFAGNKEAGFKNHYLLQIKGPQLVERLRFMGLDDNSIVNDSCLNAVFKEISRIVKMSYNGCERELVELFRIAQEYVKNTFSLPGRNIRCLPEENPEVRLLQDLSLVELTVTDKINAAIAASKIARLPGTVVPALEEATAKSL